MFPNLPRKFFVVVILVFIVLNTGLFYLFNFSLPQNVEVTDLTTSSAVLIWNTKLPETSSVFYSPNPILIKLLPLTIGFVHRVNETEKTVNHRVVVSGLKPRQKYTLSLASGIHFYKSQKVKTIGLDSQLLKISKSSLPTIATMETTDKNPSITIFGLVINKNNQGISGSLIKINTKNQSFSALTDNQGRFSLNLPELTDNFFFITALNGTASQNMISVSKNLIKQPILMGLP